ncbi:MAG: hypothetical protein R3E10_06115 [Gemmatimonadota bacterium]
MIRFRTLAVLLVSVALSASGLRAQTHDRQSLWLGVGVGGSSTRLTCQVCAAERFTGLAGYAQLGTTLSAQTRVGLEANGWWKDDPDLSQLVGSFALAAFFYPQTRGGLFFKAGPSLLYYRARDEDDDEVHSRSYGVIFGLGYELPTGGRWVLSPGLTVHASSFGRLESDQDGIVSRDVNLSLIQLTIGVTSR